MNADMLPNVGVDVALSNSKDDSSMDGHEKTAGRLSATELHGQDVVPEHRILFRVRLSLMNLSHGICHFHGSESSF